jgi:hypothetical protein
MAIYYGNEKMRFACWMTKNTDTLIILNLLAPEFYI